MSTAVFQRVETKDCTLVSKPYRNFMKLMCKFNNYGFISICSQVLPVKLHITSNFPHCQLFVTSLVYSNHLSLGLVQANQHSRRVLKTCASVVLLCRPLHATHLLPITASHHCGSVQASIFVSTNSDSEGSCSNPCDCWGSVPPRRAIGV